MAKAQNDGSERLLVVSSDGHIGPPAERYRDYVDPKYRAAYDEWFAEYIPIWMTKGTMAKDSAKKTADGDVMWGEEYQRQFEARAKEIPWGIEGKWDAQKRLEALDIDGVAADILFPDDQSANSPPFINLARDHGWKWNKYSPEIMREGARCYNRWLSDFCSAAPERLLGIGLIGSLADVDDAIETAQQAKKAGLNGGLLLPVNYYNVDEPFWNNRRYAKFWDAVQELEMPLHTHVGQGTPYYETSDNFEGPLLWTMEAAYYVHRPLWFFILGGVFERHPKLKLIFTEQGVKWASDAIQLMEGVLESHMTPFSHDERRKKFSLSPREYFHRNCAIGATYTEALGWVPPEQREILGYKSLMWGSDYPHMESAWPHTKQKLRELMEGIDHDEAKAMIGGNAVEVYKLDSRKLEQTAERIGPKASEILSG